MRRLGAAHSLRGACAWCVVLPSLVVCESPVATVSSDSETVSVPSRTAHLAPYQFKAGHAPLTGGGRPKGSISFGTVLNRAAPLLAKAYVKYALKGNATLLHDARRYFLPDEGEANGIHRQIILFLGDPAQWPRAPQPVVAAPEPSTVPPLPVDVTPSLSDADG